MLQVASKIPEFAEKAGVTVVAGPFANREHVIVMIVSAEKAESVDQFLVDSRLAHWNRVHVLPSLKMEDALQEVEEMTPVF
ncbi:hypothetical protein GTY73_32200 [Streptomyces sp. SID8354]|nr:hypothetical protein [Streptomyces sp. SID8354]